MIKIESTMIDMNEIVTLPLDNGDTLTLRKHIDGATREALVDFVATHVFDGVNYYPSRKTPLLWMAFIQGFVVDDVDVLMPNDGENADPYVVYTIVQQLQIPQYIQSADCDWINYTLSEISLAADMKIQFLMDRAHADVAGGAANVALQSVEELNSFLHRGNELMIVLQELVDKNKKKLSTLFSKKNMTALMEKFEKKFDDAIQECVKQQPHIVPGAGAHDGK